MRSNRKGRGIRCLPGVVVLFLLASAESGWCYLMPDFDHAHISWTSLGPFGLGDMDGKTCFYFGDHIQFWLPGTAAMWMWLGPAIVFAFLAALSMGLRSWIGRRRLSRTGGNEVR
jgi:hypothetical protein